MYRRQGGGSRVEMMRCEYSHAGGGVDAEQRGTGGRVSEARGRPSRTVGLPFSDPGGNPQGSRPLQKRRQRAREQGGRENSMRE